MNDLLSTLKKSLASLKEWIWSEPEPAEQKWQQVIRAVLRIHIILLREFQRDGITLRASALTYTVILSLVPTLALGTAVLKGLGAGDQMRQAAYRLVDQLESPTILGDTAEQQKIPTENLPIPDTKTEDRSPTTSPSFQHENNQEGLTVHLRKAIDKIFDYVESTNFATLGAFGILGLVITVIFVLDSIEQSMNAIWAAERERPLGRKIMDYLALMILLPVSINLAFATEATLQSPALLAHIHKILPPSLGHFLLNLLPIMLVVATFTILYRFIPNTRVKLLPALAGGFFGGVIWFMTQALYIKLQIGVSRYNAIYGSFATLPLLLLWIYLAWVIFLAGAEMAFAVQAWRNYQLEEAKLTPITRLALAFNILTTAYSDFKARKITDRASLAEQLRQPDKSLQSVLDELIQGGILRKITGKTTGYIPATPAEKMNPSEIVDLIFGNEVPPFRGSSLAMDALQGSRQALMGKKITGST